MKVGERTAVREREPSIGETQDEVEIKYQYALRQRALTGKVVIPGDELRWEQSPQGRLKYYICRAVDTGTAVKDWLLFVHDIKTHSGKHRHQGGLVIFVLEGEGYTEVEGRRLEWKAGDLLLLPIVPGGVEHQHFNKRPGEGCRWLAFIYKPHHDEIGSYVEQKERSPEYR